MSNSAIIEFDFCDIKYYIHWNGGRDSIEAFLEYAKLHEWTGENLPIRLCLIMSVFLDGSLNISNGSEYSDNGVYVVNKDAVIVQRRHGGKEQYHHDMKELLLAIDEAMPSKYQLGRSYITSEIVPYFNIKKGDYVTFLDFQGKSVTEPVVGFGQGMANGSDLTGHPYVLKYGYGDDDNKKQNCNNYPSRRDGMVRKVVKL